MTPFKPADLAARDRIRTDLSRNLCVEAGAGTGKTTVLVSRIVEVLRTWPCRCRPNRCDHVHRGGSGRDRGSSTPGTRERSRGRSPMRMS